MVCSKWYSASGMQQLVCSKWYAANGVQQMVCSKWCAANSMLQMVCSKWYAANVNINLCFQRSDKIINSVSVATVECFLQPLMLSMSVSATPIHWPWTRSRKWKGKHTACVHTPFLSMSHHHHVLLLWQ